MCTPKRLSYSRTSVSLMNQYGRDLPNSTIRPLCHTISQAAVRSRKTSSVFSFRWNPFSVVDFSKGCNLVTGAGIIPKFGLISCAWGLDAQEVCSIHCKVRWDGNLPLLPGFGTAITLAFLHIFLDRHLDQFSRFCRAHSYAQHTYELTDRQITTTDRISHCV